MRQLVWNMRHPLQSLGLRQLLILSLPHPHALMSKASSIYDMNQSVEDMFGA